MRRHWWGALGFWLVVLVCFVGFFALMWVLIGGLIEQRNVSHCVERASEVGVTFDQCLQLQPK